MIDLPILVLTALLALPQAGLQELVDAAPEGATVELPSGVWKGPLILSKKVHVKGTDVIIDGGGKGTVVFLAAPGSSIEGLTIRSSGREATGAAPDACIRIAKAAVGASVRNNTVEDCHFGIWVHETNGAHISGNRIKGDEKIHRSLRGNGIQLYNAANLHVEDNQITGGRDGIYVSTTQDSVISGNTMDRTRYGIHYMFSWSNRVTGNIVNDNQAGIALMQSRHLLIDGNVATNNKRQGLLLRDIMFSQVTNNRFEGNIEGLFFYGSNDNEVLNNELVRNEIGLKTWGHSVQNKISGNRFAGNRMQVFYVGTSDLELGINEKGNYWSDYLGWDQDGDGIGDRSYRAESFTSRLLYQYPAAVLLLRSPSLELLAHMEQRLPLLRTPTVIDRQPLMDGGRL